MADRGKSRKQVVYGATPRVDLLPAQQRAELLHERTMPKLLLAIVVSAVVAGLIWMLGMLPGQLASQRLAAAEAEAQSLAAGIGEFADVSDAIGDLTGLTATRSDIVASEVLFMSVHDEVETALPADVALVSFIGELPSVSAEASGPDGSGAALDLAPLCVAEAATITVTTTVGDDDRAASFLDALTEVTGFDCVVTTRFDGSGSGRSMTTQLALGADAFSGRFSGGDQ